LRQYVSSFRDLVAWQRAVDLTVAVHDLTASFPPHERHGLILEMRRTSRSVACNIAEAQQRRTTREYLRFLDIALGSRAELETQVRIAYRIGYLKDDEAVRVVAQCEEVGRLVRGLSRALKSRASTSPRPCRRNPTPDP
jgi:four helix bundle protein